MCIRDRGLGGCKRPRSHRGGGSRSDQSGEDAPAAGLADWQRAVLARPESEWGPADWFDYPEYVST
eukprot:11971913-Alexandrium_andersonii.AAC.1